jgi:hypothetical protein
LSISAGIRISNSSGKNEIIARYGIFRLKVFQKKEQTEKQKAKKERKALKKAQKKKQKEAQKKRGKPSKPSSIKKAKETVRTLFRSILGGEYEYLKLFYVKKLHVYYTVGGADYADVGRKFGRVSEIIGIAFPVLMRVFRIKQHRIIVLPDFAGKKSSLVYDIVILVRPIKIIKAVLAFYKASGKNDGHTGKVQNSPRQKVKKT